MSDILYYIIIYPLQLIIEILFNTFYNSGIGIGLTIFIVSLFVNLGSLPMFLSAYKLQKEERDIQEKMAPKVKSIKANFKGAEKFMMLSTYYKQNKYHPIMSLRISLSLLLEIPFFVAAYLFFSQLEIVNGMSCLFIKDLSLPDNLLTINGLTVNILPILMTIFNIISGEIYMKGYKFKEKLQMYIFAIVFLVVLYNSPSGLVLYWTFNNVISLIRNLIMKIKNKKILQYIFYIIVLIFIVYLLIKNYFLFVDIRVIFVIILYSLLVFFIWKDIKSNADRNMQKEENRVFVLSCIIIFIFIGIFIPINLFTSDVSSFCCTINPVLDFLLYPIVQSFGIFLFWPLLIYYLADNKLKRILIYVFVSFLFVGILNYILMDIKSDNITSYFDVLNIDFFNKTNYLTNLIYSCFICCFSFFLIYKRRYGFIIKFFIVLAITISILFVNNFVFLIKNKEILISIEDKNEIVNKAIHLSKTEKNILIFIVDAATGVFIPQIFKEKPELKEIYDGFIYYPKTISYHFNTNLGLPPILGGYEYTPLNLEKRDEKYKDKILEAYFVLPRIFKENKWNVSLIDIFLHLDTPGIMLNNEFYYKYDINKSNLTSNIVLGEKTERLYLSRSFFLFSVLLFLPETLKKGIYDEIKNIKKFIDIKNTYHSIKNISENVRFNEKENSFNVIYTLTCHDFELGYFDEKNNYSLIETYNVSKYRRYYDAHMATFLIIGTFLEYLKENKVYNNTRIIFVSDHGSSYDSMDSLFSFIPLLFVKDFNSIGEIKTDTTFMTNADVPLIATKDVINKPINPFTLKKLEIEKEDSCYILKDELLPFWHEKKKIFQDDSVFMCIEKEKATNEEKSIIEILEKADISIYKNIKDTKIKK